MLHLSLLGFLIGCGEDEKEIDDYEGDVAGECSDNGDTRGLRTQKQKWQQIFLKIDSLCVF